MSAKRKISVRKILHVIVTLVATTACVFAVMSAAHIENEKKLSGIELNIRNDQYHFIDKQRIMNMIINDRHIDIKDMPLGRIDVHTMESIVTANPWVANAQLYIDNTHELHINVVQRVPVARVFDRNGDSYYLDTTLSTMPLSQDYTFYTTVVTNVPQLKNDSLGRSIKAQIVSLVRFVEADTFWNAQVSQIILDSDNQFELIPVLGTHKIILGDTSGMQDKFGNLFVFYKKVLNRIGWDKYQVLDLRFKGQVVASPKLPYSGPVDKVMSNMNWAKNIIGDPAKDQASGSDTFQKKTTIQSKIIIPAAKPQQKADSPKAKAIAKPSVKKQTDKHADVKDAKQKSTAHTKSADKPKNIRVTIAKKPVAKDKRTTTIEKDKKDNKKQQPKHIYKQQ